MFSKIFGIVSTIISLSINPVASLIITLSVEPVTDVSFYPSELPYTSSSVRVALKIRHGCGSNSTNRIETVFPDNLLVKPEFKHGWTTQLQTSGGPGNFVSNITWNSNEVSNNIPDGFNELFWVWIMYPSTYQIDKMYYAPTVQHCYPTGQYKWIDTTTPSEYLAPYFTIRSTQEYGDSEYTNGYTRLDILSISTSIISIISLLMYLWDVLKNYVNKKKIPKKQVEIQIAVPDIEISVNNNL